MPYHRRKALITVAYNIAVKKQHKTVTETYQIAAIGQHETVAEIDKTDAMSELGQSTNQTSENQLSS